MRTIMKMLTILGGGERVDYYVDGANGNDTTGDGLTLATAWQTIKKALTTVPIAGGTVIGVTAGTYTESSLVLNRTFTAPVLVRPISGAVTLQGDSTAGMLIATNAQNVEFRSMTFADNALLYDVLFTSNSVNIANITFTNCTFVNSGGTTGCIGLSNVQATNITFIGCTLTASAANTKAMIVSGKAATSQYVTNLILTNCTVTGQLAAVELALAGWITGLVINSGTYTCEGTGVGIGRRTAAATGPISNTTIANATIRGNGRGINLGGGGGAGLVTNVTITNPDIDVTANNQIGILLEDYCSDVTVSGGTVIGGDTGGFGGIASQGANNSNLNFIGVNCGSDAPDPVSNRVLAMSLSGDTILVQACTFYGNGRAVSCQDNAHNVTIEDCISTAEDMGFRCGSDGAPVYTSSNIIFRRNQVTALETTAVIVGKGVQNVTVEDNTLIGGDGVFRLRGDATNSNIVIQRNTCSRNPLADGTTALVDLYGVQNVTFTDNDIDNSADVVFSTQLQDALTCADSDFTGNTIITDGDVYDIGVDTLGTGVVFDANTYTLQGAADFGSILGTPVTTLADARTAWNSYGDGTNDDNSSTV